MAKPLKPLNNQKIFPRIIAITEKITSHVKVGVKSNADIYRGNHGKVGATGAKKDVKMKNSDNGDIASDVKKPQAQLVIEDKSVKTHNETGKNPDGKPVDTVENTPISGDPISLNTGEELLQIEDATLPGLLPFTFTRLYRTSAVENQAGLGHGWHHTLSQQLDFKPEGLITWTDEEGRAVNFTFPDAEKPNVLNPVSKAALTVGDRENEFLILQPAPQPILHFLGKGTKGTLCAISDRYGNRVNIVRDNTGKHVWAVPEQEHPERRLGFAFSGAGLLQSITLDTAQGQQWQVLRTLMRYEYNDKQQLVAVTNALDETERYEYDGQHILTKRRLAGGAEFYWQWEGEGKSVRCARQWANFPQLDDRYQWDEANHAVTVLHQDGSQTYTQHDENAKVIKEVSAAGVKTERKYSAEGKLLEETDALGQVTRYHYNSADELTGVEHPDGRFTGYDWVYGQIRKVTEGEGNCQRSWTYRRTPEGDVKEFITPLEISTWYEYSEQGKLICTRYPDESAHLFIWNSKGELLEERLPDGGSRHYTYTPESWLASVTDEAGGVTRYRYDALGRVIQVIDAKNAESHYRYNAYGDVTEFTDPQGQKTLYEYDHPFGLLTKKRFASGHSLQYRYDNAQFLVSDILNEKGEKYHLDYNADGKLTEEVGFDGMKTAYRYDASGHLIEKQEFGDQHHDTPLITAYRRDPAGRLLCKVLPDGKEVHYHYDALGRLSQINDDVCPLAWEYDLADRLLAEHQGWGSLRYDYDEMNRITSAMLPDLQKTAYQYDAAGRLSGVNLNGLQMLRHEYDAAGRETARYQGNMLAQQFAWDVQGRLVRQTSSQLQYDAATKGQQWVKQLERRYHYDVADHLRRIEDSFRGQTDYVYDVREQVESVRRSQGHSERFVYDPAGNLLNNGQETRVSGNRLTLWGDRHFEYDRFGNLITEKRGKEQKLVTTYGYDCQHRLIKVEKYDGTTAEYAYDAFNRRISKTVNGKKTEFVWQGTKLAAETDSQGHYRNYFYEQESYRPLAFTEGEGAENTNVYYYHNDHLGTPQEVSDGAGNFVWMGRYDTWGKVRECDVETVENPLRFQGQYYDKETGLHYNYNRYYAPELGRFITQDPVGLEGGYNLYAYVKNPVAYVDPQGLCPETPTGAGKPKVGEPVGRSPNPLNPVQEVDAYGNEIFYRAMKEKHYDYLLENEKIKGTGETSIAPLADYAKKYDGVLVRITTKPGTAAKLQEIGIAGNPPAAEALGLPLGSTGKGSWNTKHAQFKVEPLITPNVGGSGVTKGKIMNIQLGNGPGLDIFNANIVKTEVIPKS